MIKLYYLYVSFWVNWNSYSWRSKFIFYPCIYKSHIVLYVIICVCNFLRSESKCVILIIYGYIWIVCLLCSPEMWTQIERHINQIKQRFFYITGHFTHLWKSICHEIKVFFFSFVMFLLSTRKQVNTSSSVNFCSLLQPPPHTRARSSKYI